MAWYTINYACGHTERKQLYGKEADRQKTIQFLEQQECMDCRAEEAEEAELKLADKLGCKPLVGSGKQKAWAQEIRAKYFSQSESFFLARARMFFSTFMAICDTVYKKLPEEKQTDFREKVRQVLDEMGFDKTNSETMKISIKDAIMRIAKEQGSSTFWIENREFIQGAIEELLETELTNVAEKVFIRD